MNFKNCSSYLDQLLSIFLKLKVKFSIEIFVFTWFSFLKRSSYFYLNRSDFKIYKLMEQVRLQDKSPNQAKSKGTSQSIGKDSLKKSKIQEMETRKKLEQILQQRHVNFLRRNLIEYYGKNYPLNYKPHYMFQQRWQNSNNRKQQISKANHLKFEGKLQILFYIVIIIFNTLAIWLSTIDIVIDGKKINSLDQIIFQLALSAQIIDVLIKGIKIFRYSRLSHYKFYLLEFCKINFANFLGIILFSLKLYKKQLQEHKDFLVFESIVLLLLYIDMSRNYQSFRVQNFSQQYQYHFKVADLLISLLMISHVMALILFASTKAGFQKTWISNLQFKTEDQIVFYIYSFYFATTTVLTVGYGDISPANPIEVLSVTFVQICGIIIFAYVINEIGFCLSALRKRSQILQKDFQIVEKLRKYYKLTQDVVQRVNEYLINSNEKGYQLTPQQEKGLVNKLNQELRNQVSLLNHLSIVKSSIFLVCRWSKAMQNAVAMKLQHTLFSPNNTIYQPRGKERLYFIKSGVIGVYACSDFMKKFLKTISNSLQREVADNCYGYTAALSSRKIRMQAIAKEFTSAYYIDKDKFLQCALQKTPDFEYYHEIKNKFLLAKTPESFQLPMFDSNRHHYNPNKHSLIKLQRPKNRKNKRVFFFRKQYNYALSKDVIRQQSSNTKIAEKFNGDDESQNEQQSFRFSEYKFEKTSLYKDVIIVPSSITYINDYQFKNNTTSIKNLPQKTDINDQKTEILINPKQQTEKFQKIQHFEYLFQSGKEYTNYFSKGNRSLILAKLEREFYFNYTNQISFNSINIASKNQVCAQNRVIETQKK